MFLLWWARVVSGKSVLTHNGQQWQKYSTNSVLVAGTGAATPPLLALWGPMSVYDLKHVCDQVLTPMWGAVHSQIYKEQQRMKALGWVEMEREEQESRPDLNLRRPKHEKQF